MDIEGGAVPLDFGVLFGYGYSVVLDSNFSCFHA
jgi:hypothetical protein